MEQLSLMRLVIQLFLFHSLQALLLIIIITIFTGHCPKIKIFSMIASKKKTYSIGLYH